MPLKSSSICKGTSRNDHCQDEFCFQTTAHATGQGPHRCSTVAHTGLPVPSVRGDGGWRPSAVPAERGVPPPPPCPEAGSRPGGCFVSVVHDSAAHTWPLTQTSETQICISSCASSLAICLRLYYIAPQQRGCSSSSITRTLSLCLCVSLRHEHPLRPQTNTERSQSLESFASPGSSPSTSHKPLRSALQGRWGIWFPGSQRPQDLESDSQACFTGCKCLGFYSKRCVSLATRRRQDQWERLEFEI